MKKRTNRIKKLIILMLVAVTMLAALTVTVGAQEQNNESYGQLADDGAEGNAPGADALDSFFAFLLQHSQELMCALTVLGTALVALAYKRGLLPMLRSALNSLGSAVKNINESTERDGGNIKDLKDAAEKQLSLLSERLEELGAKIDGTAARVSELCRSDGTQARLATALEDEAEMLYDLLMTSALPVYQKDAISERMKKMKERDSLEEPASEN